jgi:hypothetical protein
MHPYKTLFTFKNLKSKISIKSQNHTNEDLMKLKVGTITPQKRKAI